MSTRGLSKDTADTRVLLPVAVYEAARRLANREILSYSNWAARCIWRVVRDDAEEGLRLRRHNRPPDLG